MIVDEKKKDEKEKLIIRVIARADINYININQGSAITRYNQSFD